MQTIFDIKRFAIHDGPGIRTTVFFKGCPLRCRWCHNPESQEAAPQTIKVKRQMDGIKFLENEIIGRDAADEEIVEKVLADRMFYESSVGGVTFSGGEPLMQADALRKLLKRFKEEGLHTAVDTSGHAEPGAFKKILDWTDLFLYDLKLMDDMEHLEFTGLSNELSLQNLRYLARENKEIVIRYPLIPGYTDKPGNPEAIVAFMHSLGLKRIDVLPYHAIARQKYKRLGMSFLMEDSKAVTDKQLDAVQRFFVNQGLRINLEA